MSSSREGTFPFQNPRVRGGTERNSRASGKMVQRAESRDKHSGPIHNYGLEKQDT